MRRLAVLALSVATIATVVIVAVTLSAGPSHTQENQRILSELAQHPGSEIVEVTEYPYYNCGWPFRRRLGLATTARYRAPATATAAEVLDFYVRHLGDDWAYSDASIGATSIEPERPGETLGEIPAARFVRGKATVHVSTEGMVTFPGQPVGPARHDFTVSVDAQGAAERPYCD